MVAPTTAAIATAIWTDTTGGDFSTANSAGHIIVSQLGQTFTTNGLAVFNTASLANAPTGGSAPTAAQVATAVWQDTTAGDFTTASSIGKSLYNAFTSNTSVYTTAALANAPTGGTLRPLPKLQRRSGRTPSRAATSARPDPSACS